MSAVHLQYELHGDIIQVAVRAMGGVGATPTLRDLRYQAGQQSERIPPIPKEYGAFVDGCLLHNHSFLSQGMTIRFYPMAASPIIGGPAQDDPAITALIARVAALEVEIGELRAVNQRLLAGDTAALRQEIG